MNRKLRLLLAALAGGGLVWLLLALEAKFEADRIVLVARDTASSNPERAGNEAAIAAAAEKSFPAPLPPQLVVPSAPLEMNDRELVERPVAPETDPEWAALPRTNVKLGESFEDWDGFSAKILFRSHGLNPEDVYIPRKSRIEFAAWFEGAHSKVKELRRVQRAIADQEFNHMASRGSLKSLSFAAYVESLDQGGRKQLEEAREAYRQHLVVTGRPMDSVEDSMARWTYFPLSAMPEGAFMHGTREGKLVWATLAEMPQSQQAAALYYSAAMDMMSQILAYFRGVSRGPDDLALREVQSALSHFVPK